MYAQPTPRKPAPVAARGVLRLRRCVRPNAFGNALGGAFVNNMNSAGTQKPTLAQANANAFVDAVNGFSQAGLNRGNGVMLAGGPGYGGTGRVDPGSMESLMQPDGTYRMEISGTSADARMTSASALYASGAGDVRGPFYPASTDGYTPAEMIGVGRAYANAQGEQTFPELTISASADLSDSPLLGATAGVAASFVHMAAGAAHMGSNLLMQMGDLLTGGLNHDQPMMQQVWAEQRALGQSLVNAVTSPRLTTTNIIESVANRYNNAMVQGSAFNRSYELGKLFNDVGQGAIGLGQAVRGATRLGASGLEIIGENAFTAPTAGSMRAQRGAVTADLLTGGFLTEEKLGFGKVGSTNFTEMYRTRPAYEVAALRSEFNGLKPSFMREFASSSEAMARYKSGEFTAKALSDMAKGRVPVDYEIHHKLPIFRGGDNSFKNLDLRNLCINRIRVWCIDF